jgi:photosystem II stability/assembly factor-like uncharacterized protein
MNIKFLSFAVVLFSVLKLNAQQWSVISNQNILGGSVGTVTFFVNDSVGYSNTSKTIDGGVSWTPMFSATATDIFFTSEMVGHATRQQQQGFLEVTYEKTTDGGSTWTDMSASYPSLMGGGTLDFPSVDTGYIIRANDKLYKTVDGGDSWVLSTSNIGNVLSFVNADVGFTAGKVGSDAYLNRTLNGGVSWDSFMIPFTPRSSNNFIVAIHAISQQKIYAAVSFIQGGGIDVAVEILYSSDSGLTWTSQYTGLNKKIIDLEFPTEFNGYAVGKNSTAGESGGLVLHTIDGSNWILENINYHSIILDCHMNSDSLGWMAGVNGDVLHFPTSSSFSVNYNQAPQISYSLYPNPSNDHAIIKFENPNHICFTFKLFDTDGKIVNEIAGITEDMIVLERMNLNPGVYIFKIESNDGSIFITDKFQIK